MDPFEQATHNELQKLLRIVEKGRMEYPRKNIDLDWFLAWADGDPKTITNVTTNDVISRCERDSE